MNLESYRKLKLSVKNALLVDSDADYKKSQKLMLQRIGINVIEADASGEKVFLLVKSSLIRSVKDRSKMFDIILITDEMAGAPQTVRRIRQLGFKGFIVCVITNEETLDAAQFLESGVEAFVVKPLTLDGLVSAFEGILIYTGVLFY